MRLVYGDFCSLAQQWPARPGVRTAQACYWEAHHREVLNFMQVFGLTGGIATGKSTVAAHWTQRGLPVIDADQLAREAVAPNTSGLAEVVQLLGRQVLTPEGALNRRAVAAMIFADARLRRAIEAITHPRIHALLENRLRTLRLQGKRLVCYEASLLIEAGRADAYRPLVLVVATEALQLRRAVQRDATNQAALKARIDAQLPVQEKVTQADFVICNLGGLAELQSEADRVLIQVCQQLGQDERQYNWF
jgi:dephospho-CoA kinase